MQKAISVLEVVLSPYKVLTISPLLSKAASLTNIEAWETGLLLGHTKLQEPVVV